MARFRLGDIQASIARARSLMDEFLKLKPSADDRREVDIKLQKCEGLYEAENVIDLPIISHLASGVCFDELIDKLERLIARLKTPATLPTQPKDDGGIPWYGWAAIAAGGVGTLAILFSALSPKAAPVAVVK